MKPKVKFLKWNRDEAQNEQLNHKPFVSQKFPLFMYWVVLVESFVSSWVEDISMIFINNQIFPSGLLLEIPIAPLNLGIMPHD